jgi:hypothetical protein
MPSSPSTGSAPDNGAPIVFFGIGAKDAHRALRHISSDNDRVFYAWKSGSRWTAYVKYKKSGFVDSRLRIIALAREFANDFNVSDVVERWTENGPRAQLAIVVRIQESND